MQKKQEIIEIFLVKLLIIEKSIINVKLDVSQTKYSRTIVPDRESSIFNCSIQFLASFYSEKQCIVAKVRNSPKM